MVSLGWVGGSWVWVWVWVLGKRVQGGDAEVRTAYTESEGASMVTCHMKTFDSFGSVTLVPGTGLLVAWPSSCAGCQ